MHINAKLYPLELEANLQQLIKECILGNQLAQRRLYDRFSSTMYGICLRYSNDADGAQDILQDGFIKVFGKLKQFKAQGSFEGWMRRIFINTALEKFRNRIPILTVNEKLEIPPEIVSDSIISELAAAELLKMVQELSPQYRLVFNLFAVEGFSHKEVSETLGISEGTSKSNLSRARNILQDRIIKLRITEGRRRTGNEG